MQCPKCGYEPSLSETQSSPDSCVSCGVYYSKLKQAALEASTQNGQELPGQAAAPTKRETAPAPETVNKVTFEDWMNSNPSVRLVGVLVIGLVIGYFAGREHVKYEIKSAISDGLSGFSTALTGRQDQKPEPKKLELPKSYPIKAELVSKGFYEGGYGQDAITLSIVFKNGTDKDVRAFDGVMIFTDLLDNEILRSNVAVNDLVAASGSLSWDGSIDYNQFKDTHKGLRYSEPESTKMKFILKKVLFADGAVKEF